MTDIPGVLKFTMLTVVSFERSKCNGPTYENVNHVMAKIVSLSLEKEFLDVNGDRKRDLSNSIQKSRKKRWGKENK